MDHSDKKKEKDFKDPGESNKQEFPDVVLTHQEFESLQSRIKELEGMKEQLLRSAADFENAKKRLIREREDFTKFSQENLIRDLLPILDNLERALSHSGELQKNPAAKGFLSGVQMVAKQFSEILKNQGVKRITAVGEMFNPHHHEAIGHVEEDGKPDEIVVEIEPGYFFHDRLLRASKVKVRAPRSLNPKSEDEKQDEIT